MIAKIIVVATLIGHFTGTAFAGSALAGFWIGDQSKDPITDKPCSMAMTYDRSDRGSLALRCRDGAVDVFVATQNRNLSVGDMKDVILRFDSGTPLTLQGIVVEPNLLALRHNHDVPMLSGFLSAESIVVRFAGLYGRQNTFEFQSTLSPANSLSIVGRVLADCGIAPFPKVKSRP